MIKSIAVVIALCLSLFGCGYSATTESVVAQVAGCEIIRVKIKDESYPIYLAKCLNTATVTYNTGGKSNHRGVTVTTVEQETSELERIKSELEKKKSALAKLSDEDKEILGLR